MCPHPNSSKSTTWQLISQLFVNARRIIERLKLKRVILTAPRFVGSITISAGRKIVFGSSKRVDSSDTSSLIVINGTFLDFCLQIESISE